MVLVLLLQGPGLGFKGVGSVLSLNCAAGARERQRLSNLDVGPGVGFREPVQRGPAHSRGRHRWVVGPRGFSNLGV
jgi:hypothetical protein